MKDQILNKAFCLFPHVFTSLSPVGMVWLIVANSWARLIGHKLHLLLIKQRRGGECLVYVRVSMCVCVVGLVQVSPRVCFSLRGKGGLTGKLPCYYHQKAFCQHILLMPMDKQTVVKQSHVFISVTEEFIQWSHLLNSSAPTQYGFINQELAPFNLYIRKYLKIDWIEQHVLMLWFLWASLFWKYAIQCNWTCFHQLMRKTRPALSKVCNGSKTYRLYVHRFWVD